MKFISTFEKHKKEPKISVDEYIRSRCIQLGKSVLDHKIVYLDTNFWINLRDVSLGRKSSKVAIDFYEKVMELVRLGTYIFPISEDIFLEVLNQTDEVTINETVTLIDSLSKGVSLISLDERVSLELLHFMHDSTGSEVYNCKELVWTKLTYNMGFTTPVNDRIDEKLDQLIQKAFVDQMWAISLSDMIEVMKKNGGSLFPKRPSLADSLNRGKFEHAHENISFQEMFLSELAGILDIYKSEFPRIMAIIYKQKTGNSATENEINNSKSGRLLFNLIYNLFKLGKAKDKFPTIGVLAGLYAATRWDKTQKFEDNDIHDFRHAASALPYADYFFTEKGLAHLITQKSTEYDKLYSCNVQSKIKGASEALSETKAKSLNPTAYA